MAALTPAELMALWYSVVDRSYSQPFQDAAAAGRQGHIEVFEQAAEQFARASEMVERSTQAMYLRPWSGQSDQPAAGEGRATVTLTITRTKLFEKTITLTAGSILFEELTNDYGPNGAVEVATGRRFMLTQTVTFAPGEAGPVSVTAIAENPGYGYNLCEIGSIRQISQPGAELTNMRATVVLGGGAHRLIVTPTPDVVVPEHVGQYIEFIGGLNTGSIARVIGYERPSPTGVVHGGVALLAPTAVVRGVIVGVFVEGETVTLPGISGVLLRVNGDQLIIDRSSGGPLTVGATVTGAVSGATALITQVDQSGDLFAEQPGNPPGAIGAAWRAIPWADDLGIVVTNAAVPAGGRSAMLDELGDERKIYRQPNESDESYRKRVSQVADQISPNAIRRICNRILVPLGASICLRESGLPKFQGLYFDVDPGADPVRAFAFDLDFAVRPADRFKLLVDYLEMRAFFLVGVPPLGSEDFGAAFDEGASNAFDCSPYWCFFDGYSLTAANIYRQLWAAIDAARAAGVGFDLYVENIGCI